MIKDIAMVVTDEFADLPVFAPKNIWLTAVRPGSLT